MRIAVTGSSGLVGRRLASALRARGDEVLPVSRSGSGDLQWSVDGPVDLAPADGRPLDAVVHLAGAPIAGQRWTARYKEEIRRSRVAGTAQLVAGLEATPSPPPVLVSASAIAVYGPACGDRALVESAWDLGPDAGDFLTDVARGWERAAAAYTAGRVVRARFGIILADEGGALEKMKLPFQLFIGGPLGSGRQYMSWVALDDVVGALLRALDDATLAGPLNVTAPAPVPNKAFSTALGRALGRPSWAPVPAFALRLAAGEIADGALLVSHRVLPERLEQAGFVFAQPELEGALKAVVG